MKGNAFLADEIVVQPDGKPRQAGATTADGAQIARWREAAQRSLYFLARGVLNCHWLTPTLHRPICDWLQTTPPRRKMLMVPRGHGKTTIVAQVLPLHVWIQPKESNQYFENFDGRDVNMLLCGEKEGLAKDNLRVVQAYLEGNELFRALWPHLAWPNPRRDAPKWNDVELILPRARESRDPSMRAIGIGGAVTGSHPHMLIKDDLTTEEAANFPIVMQRAVDWHVNSRALLANPDTGLEFITCTRWAVADLPEYIMHKDPTVSVNTQWRSITEGGKPIYPEHFGQPGTIERLQREFGVRFSLLYMNSVEDSTLCDFSEADLRYFEQRGDALAFNEDDRDVDMSTELNKPRPQPTAPLPRRLHDEVTQDMLRNKFIRRDRYA